MEFLDRIAELGRLRRLVSAHQGGLAIVWGRRRVGKTRLLIEWCGPKGLYWVADTGAAALQLRNFAETVATRLPGFADVEYPSWTSLFARLGRDARAARFRGPLVIDELPYLLPTSPELPGALQRFVDHDLEAAGLILALAGSSQRMMQGLALSSDAPLYGRAKELFKVEPLPPGCIVAALASGSSQAAVRHYAAWGGIPRYWELAAEYDDLRQAVDALVLDPMGPLHEEPARLLLEETPPAIALRPILDVIGAGAHRLSEIAGRIGQPATSLSRPLTRLQELDLVVRETPFGEPERATKRALYKLADPFLALWFSVVAAKRSALTVLPRAGRLRLFDQAFPRLVAAAWEGLCRRAVPLLAERLGLEYGPAARYWSSPGNEWDVVARGADGSLLVGEAKWSEGRTTVTSLERDIQELIAKGVPRLAGAESNEVRYVLFVPERPQGRGRTAGNVRVLDARDVLEVLR